MPKSNPQVAFVVAALVLMVLPLLVLPGASALGFAVRLGLDRVAGRVFFVAFGVWVAIVLAAILVLIARINRRTRS